MIVQVDGMNETLSSDRQSHFEAEVRAALLPIPTPEPEAMNSDGREVPPGPYYTDEQLESMSKEFKLKCVARHLELCGNSQEEIEMLFALSEADKEEFERRFRKATRRFDSRPFYVVDGPAQGQWLVPNGLMHTYNEKVGEDRYMRRLYEWGHASNGDFVLILYRPYQASATA